MKKPADTRFRSSKVEKTTFGGLSMERGKLLLPMEGLVRFKQLLAHYPVSKSQIYQEISEGFFPEQVQKGRPAFWDAITIREFLQKNGATLIDGPRLPMEGFVRIRQILLHYPVSISYLYAEMQEGRFPERKTYRGRVALWDVTEFRAFLKNAGAILLE